MKQSTGLIRRPWRASSPAARIGVAVIAAVGLALPAAAIGSGQPANTQDALAYSHCMRSHGVSNWPDPVVDAGGDPEFYLDGRINQNSPQIKAKIHDCVHWIPAEAISPGNPIACPGTNPGGGSGCGACSCMRRT